jgi:hypothetical protein
VDLAIEKIKADTASDATIMESTITDDLLNVEKRQQTSLQPNCRQQ